MLAARENRPAPLCDDKIITAWNGLMIAAYADGYRVLKNEAYRHAAERCAEFLLKRCASRAGACCERTGPGRPSCPPIWKIMHSWCTGCCGFMPPPVNPAG